VLFLPLPKGRTTAQDDEKSASYAFTEHKDRVRFSVGFDVLNPTEKIVNFNQSVVDSQGRVLNTWADIINRANLGMVRIGEV